MKTTVRPLLFALMGLLLAAPGALAQNETANAIRQKIQTMYQQFRDGNFDAYLENYAVGSTRFGANGGLRSTPATAESLKATAANFKATRERGARNNTTPKHIAVRVYGSTAVATYYVEGNVTNQQGETRRVLQRGTRVFAEEGGQWKVVHTHISDIQSPSE